ncbi:ExbD/TolR family protein [Hydrocarboniphaga effusa]|jgi:biopolymer transport protein ExbD|uniref:ExbD/TolR family protein n=1 Tax=Hydrocarboniphaga effusa TaxID=243629 RepID=UPI0035B40DFE
MRLRNRRMSEANVEETGIDLAPMLDFVLNLLIFFIITAVFMKEVGITVSRPNASSSTEKKESSSIVIVINDAGDIVVDKKLTDERSVRAAIERLHAQRPEDAVVVVPESGAPTGILVSVIDQVRQGGVMAVSIAPGESST